MRPSFLSLSPEPFRPSFEILHRDDQSFARRGRLQLKQGQVETPVFMPVGTHGTVRGIAAHDLEASDSQIMLCNTYHLYVRPGVEAIEKAGGLHRWNSWKRPILTDSGGFQVFSLAERRKISEDGVEFQNPRNGDRIYLTPEKVIEAQQAFGSDVMMVLDECAPAHSTYFEFKNAVERSTRWAERCLKSHTQKELALFAIVQGGSHQDLRRKSLDDLLALESSSAEFTGWAIGGMSVGEEKEKFVSTLYDIRGWLPEEKPHYLMGVGTPRDLVFGVACGIDMFDCVLPSRNGRHGIVMTRSGRLNLYNEKFKADERALEEGCPCPICARYSRAFIRHLFFIEDMLAGHFVTLHNIYYFLHLMSEIRRRIEDGSFVDFARDFLAGSQHIFLGSEQGFQAYPTLFRD